MTLDSAQLKAQLFNDNVTRARLSDATLTLVKEAPRHAQVVELDDGTPALRHGARILGGALDDESLLQITQSAGNPMTFVVFGLGMGHTVRGLRAYSTAKIVVFEPDPGIVRSFFESGPSELAEVPIVCTVHELTQLWPRLSNGKQSVTLLNTPGYAELFPDQAQSLREALGQLVQRSSVNHATLRLRSRVWIQDVLANLDLLGQHPTFLALAGKYRGVPAFIVGAGPSLAKNGGQLAEAAKKGIVFALNSSARALDSYGVEPQVLACMESIDVSHLLEQVSYIDRVVRAFSLTGHPRSLRTGKGPLLPIFEGLAQLNVSLAPLLGSAGLPVSGSVSTLAFSLAERLGCSPIVFVGQDLAYTDGKAYAQGTPYENSRVRVAADGQTLEHDWCETLKATHNHGDNKMLEREPLRSALAWGGQGHVTTTIGFNVVRAWLETASVVLAEEKPGTRLINATEGGARIEGFEECTLETLLATLPEQGITAEALYADAERAQAPLAVTRLAGWYDEQMRLTRSVRHAARRVRRLGEACQVALDQDQSAKVRKTFEKLDIAELTLKAAAARMPFIDCWANADIDAVVEASSSSEVKLADDYDSARRSVALEVSIARVIEEGAGDVERELRLAAGRLGVAMTADPISDSAIAKNLGHE
ncbi:MAG: 6-hydroxymethylpterin diphosphokinase MptE-like protein [Polyangiaceae bacterium]